VTERETPAVLRPAEPADLPALVEIEQVAFAGESWSDVIVRQELAGPGRHYVVAERDGAVVGYAGAFLGDDADILTVGVLPAHRRSGIGRILILDLIEAARQARVRAILLEVREDNQPAIGLYASLGFESIAVRRHYYGPGRHATVMRLALVDCRPAAGSP
jgi:ribosomal-protein-alanine N-acetyltransferase